MATIGTLAVNVVANTGRFQKGMKSAGKATSRFATIVKLAKSKVLGFGAALGAGITVAAAARLAQGQFTAVDALGNMADKLGFATEKLAAYQLAAQIGGVSSEQLGTSLQRMLKAISDAGQGLATQKRAFDQLGLSVDNLKSLAPSEAFKQIGEALNGVASRADKVRIAMDVFGRSGAGLLNVFAAGRESLEKFERVTRTFGTAISNLATKKIELANDSFTLLREAVTGLGRSMAVELAPFVLSTGDGLTKMAQEGFNARNAVRSLVDEITGVIAPLMTASQVLGAIFQPVEIGATAAFAAITRGLLEILKLTDRAAKFMGVSLGDSFAGLLRQTETFSNELALKTKSLVLENVQTVKDIFSGQTAGKVFLDNITKSRKQIDAMARQAVATTESLNQLEAIRKVSLSFDTGLKPDFTPFATFNGKKAKPEPPIQTDIGQSPTVAALERGTSAAFSAARAGGANNLASKQLALTQIIADKLSSIEGDTRRGRRIIPGIA